MTYELRTVSREPDWTAWHAIRQRVLFEARGQFGVYDPNHPSLASTDHHPFLLLHRGDPIGAIAVELDGSEAWLRRVAIREDVQRSGHGRRMVEMAMDFARSRGARRVKSNVDEDAVAFYRQLGFTETGQVLEHGVQMELVL